MLIKPRGAFKSRQSYHNYKLKSIWIKQQSSNKNTERRRRLCQMTSSNLRLGRVGDGVRFHKGQDWVIAPGGWSTTDRSENRHVFVSATTEQPRAENGEHHAAFALRSSRGLLSWRFHRCAAFNPAYVKELANLKWKTTHGEVSGTGVSNAETSQTESGDMKLSHPCGRIRNSWQTALGCFCFCIKDLNHMCIIWVTSSFVNSNLMHYAVKGPDYSVH